MDEHRQDLCFSWIGRIGAKVPEVGIEGEVAGSPDKTHQLAIGARHAQVPDAQLQHPLPALGLPGLITRCQQQPVEGLGSWLQAIGQ